MTDMTKGKHNIEREQRKKEKHIQNLVVTQYTLKCAA